MPWRAKRLLGATAVPRKFPSFETGRYPRASLLRDVETLLKPPICFI